MGFLLTNKENTSAFQYACKAICFATQYKNIKRIDANKRRNNYYVCKHFEGLQRIFFYSKEYHKCLENNALF